MTEKRSARIYLDYPLEMRKYLLIVVALIIMTEKISQKDCL